MAEVLGEFFTGTTIRPQVTFKDFNEENADPEDVTVTIYDPEQNAISTGLAESAGIVGVWRYDWTLPDEPGKYSIEFRGVLDDLPTVIRGDVKARFRV